MAAKPTAVDAELILKLYELHREPEMRKARSWWLADFWPQSTEEIVKLSSNLKAPENHWLRQGLGYWEMAAMLVLSGTLNEQMFLDLGVSGEMFMVYAKIAPLLAEIRRQLANPELFANLEKLIEGSKIAKERLSRFDERLRQRRNLMQEAAAAQAS